MGELLEERRRFIRYPIYCPAQYKRQSVLFRDPSITINISEGGALITTRKGIDISSGLILRFCFKGKDFNIRSRVVHVQYDIQSSLYSVGVEFLERPVDFIMNFYAEIGTIMLLQRKLTEESGTEISLAEASIKWYSDVPAWQ